KPSQAKTLLGNFDGAGTGYAGGAQAMAPLPPATSSPSQAPTLVIDEPEPLPSSTAKGFQPAAQLPPQHLVLQQPQFTVPQPLPAPARAPVILDVTPRGLGVGTVAGYCEELIRRNSRVPTEVRKLFTTSRDSQESVRIIVCQGESRRLDNNVVLGDLM